jgi:TetR/AcrR family fatty acid metabolism transcriptional regulator
MFVKTERKAIDRRAVILDAALRTFVKRGYPDTKVAEIASEAGVAEGTLYNYFASKEDLLLALFDEKWGWIINEIRKKISRLNDPNRKLKAIFSLVVRMFKKNRQLAELFMVDIKQSSVFLNNYTINRIVEFLDLIEEVLEEGKKKGTYRRDLDTRVARMVIFGAAQGILLSWVLSESNAMRNQTFKFSLYRAAKTLKDVFKSGLVGEK